MSEGIHQVEIQLGIGISDVYFQIAVQYSDSWW